MTVNTNNIKVVFPELDVSIINDVNTCKIFNIKTFPYEINIPKTYYIENFLIKSDIKDLYYADISIYLDLLIISKYIKTTSNSKGIKILLDLCKKYDIDSNFISIDIRSIGDIKIEYNEVLTLLKCKDFNEKILLDIVLDYLYLSDNNRSNRYNTIKDILNKLENNNVVYFMSESTYSYIWPRSIMKQFTNPSTLDVFDSIKYSFNHCFKKVDNKKINFMNCKGKQDNELTKIVNGYVRNKYPNKTQILSSIFEYCKGKSNELPFNIYDFNSLMEYNNLIEDSVFNGNDKLLDLATIALLKPKLLFNNACYNTFKYMLQSNDCEKHKELEDILHLAFYILFCTLNYCQINDKNGDIFDINSPFVHKLSTLNKAFFENKGFKVPLYSLIKPITKETGKWVIRISNKENCDIKHYNIETVEDHTDIFKNAECNLNNYIEAYNRLKEFTLGIFQHDDIYDFNYYQSYKPDVYNAYKPRVMLSGSCIGCYCLPKRINVEKFNDSDIDIVVKDSYLLYEVKKNIISNIKKMSNKNYNYFRSSLFKMLYLRKRLTNNLIKIILDFIDVNIIIEYNVKVNKNNTKYYRHMVKCDFIKSKLQEYRSRYKLNDDTIADIIKSVRYFNGDTHRETPVNIDKEEFIFKSLSKIDNFKITLLNIKYVNERYTLTNYRNIDIYISDISKITTYHESYVRSCYTNGEFYMYTDCLNSILTRTAIDNKHFFVNKNPIDVLIKKHEQCVKYRIFDNLSTFMGFLYMFIYKKKCVDVFVMLYNVIKDLYRLIIETTKTSTCYRLKFKDCSIYIKQY